MKDAYFAMWHTNGNIAFVWHALMLAAVIIIACRVWIARRNRYFDPRANPSERYWNRRHPEDDNGTTYPHRDDY
jgi:hypothetical protein